MTTTLAPSRPVVSRALAAELEQERVAAHERHVAGDLVGALADHLAIIDRAPFFGRAYGSAIPIAQTLCDWSTANRLFETAMALDATDDRPYVFPAVRPFTMLSFDVDPGVVRRATERYVSRVHPDVAPRRAPRDLRDRKVRLGYLSADVRDHPVMHLGVDLFAHHDRDRFEVICFSTATDDGSRIRERVVNDADRFVDLFEIPDAAARRSMAESNLDIVIDLSAHTQYGRHDLLAARPAPLQVHYLGFPGTTGARYVDAFIGDEVTIPDGAEKGFTEQVVRLPRCYQANQPLGTRAGIWADRAAHGLPPDAVVLASFNSSYKVEPTVFARWMRVLRRVPDAVLWLLASVPEVPDNLRRQAEIAGVDPNRLHFAPPIDRSRHLDRLALADLCLDTWIVGGHTTTSDALRMGVPVVASPREPFISRVAASLLHEVDMAELVTSDLDAYEALIVDLATDRRRLRKIRRRTERRVRRSRLFDPAHATACLEKALLDLAADTFDRSQEES